MAGTKVRTAAKKSGIKCPVGHWVKWFSLEKGYYTCHRTKRAAQQSKALHPYVPEMYEYALNLYQMTATGPKLPTRR